MKTLISTIILTLLLTNFASANNASSIREEFHKNELNREIVENMLSVYGDDQSPLGKAYIGLCTAYMAQYVFLPTSKFKSFFDGKDLLDTSIEENRENGEQRYLRLLIQLNAPSFLLYNKNIDSDLEVFMQDVKDKNIDPEWSSIFITNLLKGKKLSDEQVQKLISLQNNLS